MFECIRRFFPLNSHIRSYDTEKKAGKMMADLVQKEQWSKRMKDRNILRKYVAKTSEKDQNIGDFCGIFVDQVLQTGPPLFLLQYTLVRHRQNILWI